MPNILPKDLTNEDLSSQDYLQNLATLDNKPSMLERMASDTTSYASTDVRSGILAHSKPTTHIIFLDGTWNNEKSQTHISKLFNSIAREQEQRAVYFSGIGANDPWLKRAIAGATGLGLRNYVKAAYLDLVENYKEGDEIVLTGYSRGAYTARALVGMINKSGLIDKEKVGWKNLTQAQKMNMVEAMFEFYKRTDIKPHDEAAKKFRARNCYTDASGNVTSTIKGLCVFDTVGALGVPDTGLLKAINFLTQDAYKFYDTHVSSIVEKCFHACAADEKRIAFPITLALPSTKKSAAQTIVNMIFKGEHYVGGGTPERQGLADIAGDWMARMMQTQLGVQFNEAVLAQTFKPDVMDNVDVRTKSGFLGKFGKKLRDFSVGVNFTDAAQNVVFVHPSVRQKEEVDPDQKTPNILGILPAPVQFV